MIDGFISRASFLRKSYELVTDKPAVDAMFTRLQVNRLQRGVCQSHSHYDHALDIAYIAQRTGAKLYGCIEH